MVRFELSRVAWTVPIDRRTIVVDSGSDVSSPSMMVASSFQFQAPVSSSISAKTATAEPGGAVRYPAVPRGDSMEPKNQITPTTNNPPRQAASPIGCAHLRNQGATDGAGVSRDGAASFLGKGAVCAVASDSGTGSLNRANTAARLSSFNGRSSAGFAMTSSSPIVFCNRSCNARSSGSALMASCKSAATLPSYSPSKSAVMRASNSARRSFANGSSAGMAVLVEFRPERLGQRSPGQSPGCGGDNAMSPERA